MTFDRNGNFLFGSQGGIWRIFQDRQRLHLADGKGLGRNANGNLYYGHNHDPNDPTVVYRSTDDGNTWSAFDSGLPPSLEAHRFVVNTTDRKLYAVIEDGSSNNGWLYCTTNLVQ